VGDGMKYNDDWIYRSKEEFKLTDKDIEFLGDLSIEILKEYKDKMNDFLMHYHPRIYSELRVKVEEKIKERFPNYPHSAVLFFRHFVLKPVFMLSDTLYNVFEFSKKY
jgi:myo-inositol catabolism protein IolC